VALAQDKLALARFELNHKIQSLKYRNTEVDQEHRRLKALSDEKKEFFKVQYEKAKAMKAAAEKKTPRTPEIEELFLTVS
jgi:hypothetical protein